MRHADSDILSRSRRDTSVFARRIALAACAFAMLSGSAGVRAGEGDDRYTVIKTKKAITISGEEIADAMIVITGGKIEAVGKKVDYPSDSRVIDLSNLVAMPGMIDPHTSIGLAPINRSGNQSHRSVASTYYPPDDDTYERLLESGYTMLALYPPGSGAPGQYLVQSTYQPKDHAGLKDAGLVRIAFTRPASDKRLLRDALKAAQAEIDKEKEASTKPADGAASKPVATSQPASKPAEQPTSRPATQPATTKPATTQPAATKPAAPTIPPHIQTFVSLLKKKEGFAALVELGRASDVLHYADAIGDTSFPSAYLFPGNDVSDIFNVVDHELLGGANALVAIRPVLMNEPMTVNPYNAAKIFIEAGCTVAFFPASESVEEHERMLERLAMMVRTGMDRKDALKAVTLNAAKLIQMDKEYGAIAKDKWADLIFLNGDPLDPGVEVKRVMIHGDLVWDAAKSRQAKR